MAILDIVLGGILVYGCIRGIWNGFFVELASFISLLIGVFIAIKFSVFTQSLLKNHVSWSPKSIEIIAFIMTFVLVVIGIYFLAKFLTTLANFAGLGCFNKIFGGFFGVLKIILMLSVFLNFFLKINSNNTFIDKETIDKSVFFNPIQKVAGFIYPSFLEWFEDLKK